MNVALFAQGWYYMMILIVWILYTVQRCRHKHYLSPRHTHTHECMYMFIYQLPCWKGKLNNEQCGLQCYVCIPVLLVFASTCLPLRISEACIRTLACICLSACIGPYVSQKQHITQLSLHPEEGPFHLRKLLVELRRIFPTVSLTLCW